MRLSHMILMTGAFLLILTMGLGMSSTLKELPPLETPSTSPEPLKQKSVEPGQITKKPSENTAPDTLKEGKMEPGTPERGKVTEGVTKTPELHPNYPFYPSLVQTDSGEAVSLDLFTGAHECGVCHKQIYSQWKGSMHAASFTDPIWRAFVALGSEETGGKTDKLCIGCHTPVGMVTGDVKDVEGVFSEDTDPVSTFGVQCDACHVMSESHGRSSQFGEPGNGSFVMAPGKVKRGPYEDCDAMVHEGIWSSLHVTSKICANCHQSFHGNVPLERTYDEWKHSIYARKGIQCQGCHMMPVDKALEVARTLTPPEITGQASELKPERSPFFPHWFLGANFSMTRQNGFQDQAREIMHRLQTAAALEMEVSDAVLSPGQLLRLKVKVRNVAAGHNLPTSLTELRQMWLNIQALDKDGRVFYHSGNLTDAGAIEQGTKIFDAYAVDENGQHTVKPWKIDHFLWDHTIPPKGMAVEEYTFQIPKGIQKEVQLIIKLRYRSYPQSLVNELLKEKYFEVPVVDMVEKRLVLPVVGQ